MINLGIQWITFISAILNLSLTLYLLRQAQVSPITKEHIKILKDRIKQRKAKVISPMQLQADKEAIKQILSPDNE